MFNFQVTLLTLIFAGLLVGLTWLFTAYAVWFIRTRRRIAFNTSFFLILLAFVYLPDLWDSYQISKLSGNVTWWSRDSISMITGCVAVWAYIGLLWLNKDKLYGFSDTRDFLFLQKLTAPIFNTDPSKGLFVPSVEQAKDVETVNFGEWLRTEPQRLKRAFIRLPLLLIVIILASAIISFIMFVIANIFGITW